MEELFGLPIKALEGGVLFAVIVALLVFLGFVLYYWYKSAKLYKKQLQELNREFRQSLEEQNKEFVEFMERTVSTMENLATKIESILSVIKKNGHS